MADFTNTNDIIDVRDIIARVEELRESRDELRESRDELETLENLLEELKGNGGDEQWLGDWYPVTLIRYSHFENYAQELAEECGLVNADAKWPNNCIDWGKAARELQWDYSLVEFDGVDYWYR